MIFRPLSMFRLSLLHSFFSNVFTLVQWATLVKGDLKASFSIATTLRCRGGHYSIPLIIPLYTNLIKFSVKQGCIKYHFLVFGMTRPGFEPWFPGPLANTLLFQSLMYTYMGGARGVVVITVGNEHGDTSSNPGRY